MAKTTFNPDEQVAVLVDEVCARTGYPLEPVYEALRPYITRDWANRAVVSAAVARRYVEGIEEDRRRRAQLEAEFQDYVRRWQAARDEAYAGAVAAALEEARQEKRRMLAAQNIIDMTQWDSLPGPLSAKAADAARAAVAKWEAEHPRANSCDEYAAARDRFERSLR